MAHDVSFHNSKKEEEVCYFFGYAGGIFYKEFNAEHLDMGISGSNDFILRNREEVLQALKKIEESPQIRKYPDPDRFPDFMKDFERVHKGTERFKIYFT